MDVECIAELGTSFIRWWPSPERRELESLTEPAGRGPFVGLGVLVLMMKPGMMPFLWLGCGIPVNVFGMLKARVVLRSTAGLAEAVAALRVVVVPLILLLLSERTFSLLMRSNVPNAVAALTASMPVSPIQCQQHPHEISASRHGNSTIIRIVDVPELRDHHSATHVVSVRLEPIRADDLGHMGSVEVMRFRRVRLSA